MTSGRRLLSQMNKVIRILSCRNMRTPICQCLTLDFDKTKHTGSQTEGRWHDVESGFVPPICFRGRKLCRMFLMYHPDNRGRCSLVKPERCIYYQLYLILSGSKNMAHTTVLYVECSQLQLSDEIYYCSTINIRDFEHTALCLR